MASSFSFSRMAGASDEPYKSVIGKVRSWLEKAATYRLLTQIH